VKIDGAKYTADYKGTKYYFCSEGCKTEFTKSPEKYLGQTAGATAKDPVCGMSVKIDGAKYTADYKGTKYYFCSEGCKTEFTKNPEKYLTPNDAPKPMGGMKMQGEMENCPMMMKDVEKTFTNTKDGVTITLSAKSPETVKKVQDWAAKMKEGKGGMAGHGEEDCPMGADCPKMKK
jgi:YHS domain-containing protein